MTQLEIAYFERIGWADSNYFLRPLLPPPRTSREPRRYFYLRPVWTSTEWTRGGETFTYDGANRLLRSVQNGRTIVYSYNVPSRIRTVTYPGGRTIEQMDFRNWLSKVNEAM